jgi:hypothetical protein
MLQLLEVPQQTFLGLKVLVDPRVPKDRIIIRRIDGTELTLYNLCLDTNPEGSCASSTL